MPWLHDYRSRRQIFFAICLIGLVSVPARAEVDKDGFDDGQCACQADASSTDRDAKHRKGVGMVARLAFLGHALMENRCGLIVDACLTGQRPAEHRRFGDV